MIKVRTKKKKPKRFSNEEKATIIAFYTAMAFFFFFTGAAIFNQGPRKSGVVEKNERIEKSIPLSAIVNICPPQFDHCNFKQESQTK